MLLNSRWRPLFLFLLSVLFSKRDITANPDLRDSSRDQATHKFSKARLKASDEEYDVDELADVYEYDGEITWTTRDGRTRSAFIGDKGKYHWMGKEEEGSHRCFGSKENCSQKLPSWEEWGPYSACSVSCGAGVRLRHRKCSQPGKCVGNNEEDETCILRTCPNNKADKPQSEHSDGDEVQDDAADYQNEFENEAVDDNEAGEDYSKAGDDHREGQAEGHEETEKNSKQEHRGQSYSGDEGHRDASPDFDDDVSVGEDTIEADRQEETKSSQREGNRGENEEKADEGRNDEKGRERRRASFDDESGDGRDTRRDGMNSADDVSEDENGRGKKGQDGEEEKEEEEEDKDEEEEKKGRRRRRKKKKKKKTTGDSSSSSSESSSGSWSYESQSSSGSDQEHPSVDRPKSLDLLSASPLHIRPRSSSYGALSSPDGHIDDDILETPPSDTPRKEGVRLITPGPWQYGGDQNFEDCYTIASQYAMPVTLPDLNDLETSAPQQGHNTNNGLLDQPSNSTVNQNANTSHSNTYP